MSKNNILEFVEEKFERRLSEEIAAVRIEIAGLEKGLTAKISENYAGTIKWMFIFWVGQVGVILGILLAFFKK